MSRSRWRVPAAIVAIGLGLSALPALGLPAFYESFLYLVFSWIALATSWSILSGYAGYFSFGHGAFFGAGMYTTATLAVGFGVPFLATLPVAGVLAALLATGIGAVVFRVKRLRGELFGLLTLAITFVLATIVLNTRIDGGPGVYLLGVAIPRLVASPAGTIYLLGLALAVASLCVAHRVWRSRFGLGLFAIHDDEDVAEVKGVPTFRYKLLAFALSAGIAGVAGGVHAVYVSYVTVGETFAITVPLYVVLMSILGGARHWLGPAVGAAIITASLYAFTRGEAAVIGRAVVAFALILVILLLPEGIVPAVIRRWRAVRGVGPRPAAARAAESGAAAAAGPRTATGPRPHDDDACRSPLARDRLAETSPILWDERRAEGATGPGPPDVAGRPGRVALRCEDVDKSFGGIRALRGVSLHVEGGEIVGLVGPNGSGKTTLINLISGHHAADRGRIALGGTLLSGRPAHQIAGLGISRTYQIPRPFNHLTVLENVVQAATFGAEARSLGQARAEAREWLEFAGLARRASALPPELNLHERKFLELARALAGRPRVILLDEVLSGLNPGEIASAIRLVRGIREAGTSILFVEHVMRAVLELSDRVVVLNEGEVIAAGPPREAMRDPHVVRVYLGKTHAA